MRESFATFANQSAILCGWCLLCFCFVQGGLLFELRAHHQSSERRVVLQRDREGLAALWSLELRGQDARIFYEMIDLDHDGQLGKLERKLASHKLLRRATAGLSLAVGDHVLSVVERKAELDIEALVAGSLTAYGLIAYNLPAPSNDLDGAEVITLTAAMGVGRLGVDVQTRDGWRLLSRARTPVHKDGTGLVETIFLESGEKMRFVFQQGVERR